MESKELVYQRTRHVVRKSAIDGGDKLRDEIKWLLSLPPCVAKHFPSVLEHSLKTNNTYYYMPFYELPTFRALLFGGLQLSQAERVVDKVLTFLFNDLYPTRTFNSVSDHFKETHISRVWQRLDEAAKEHKYFAELLSTPTLEINGKEFENLPGLLARCERDTKLCLRLSPPRLVFVHGDMHFDNMLIDLAPDGKVNHFILIDPRGFHHGQDVAYDLGKLWHSFHGCYDHIIYDQFQLREDWSEPSKPRFEFLFTNEGLRQLYSNVGQIIETKLARFLRDDHDWQLRTRFTEAMHFASLAPFHIEKETRVKALHLVAVQLLSECLESWHSARMGPKTKHG